MENGFQDNNAELLIKLSIKLSVDNVYDIFGNKLDGGIANTLTTNITISDYDATNKDVWRLLSKSISKEVFGAPRDNIFFVAVVENVNAIYSTDFTFEEALSVIQQSASVIKRAVPAVIVINAYPKY